MKKLRCYNCDHKWEGRENSRKCPKCISDDIGVEFTDKQITLIGASRAGYMLNIVDLIESNKSEFICFRKKESHD